MSYVPEHINELRLRAQLELAAKGAPREAEELWRYSGIDRFSADRFASDHRPEAVGRVTVELGDEARAKGATVTIDDGDAFADDYFATLGRSSVAHRLVITIPANVALTGPIRIRTTLAAAGTVGGSVRVICGVNSSATVLEEFRSDDRGEDASLLISGTVLVLADGARLQHASVQLLGERHWMVATLRAETGRDATLSSIAVALGGDYARLETTAVATAKGAHSELLAVYFAGNDQVHDFRTRQDHIAPRTTSDLLFKGAVEDRARSVYSGLIHIGKDARGTVAHQTNRNLLLSAGASAESVPNLEIENNDVQCSHASAIGPIDDDHRYYLESRGVPPSQADRLIVLGFFADLLARVPDDALRRELEAVVGDKFDRRAQSEVSELDPAAALAQRHVSR